MQVSKPFLDVVPIDVMPIDVVPRGYAKGIATTLAAAFVQDPFMSFVFPEVFKREPQLAKLFTPVVRYAITYGKVELLGDGDGARYGAIAWVPSQYFSPTMLPMIRSGLLWVPWQIGRSAFDRLQGHELFCEHEIERKAPAGFAYLWLLGVCPSAQGKGLAKRLIHKALDSMRELGHSACVLRTDNENNVTFYQRLGFSMIDAGIVPSSQLPYWLFQKELW